MHEPAARHGEIGFRRVKLPVGLCQRPGITAEDGSLIEQPGLPDSLVHAAGRLPHPGVKADSSTASAGAAGASAQSRVAGPPRLLGVVLDGLRRHDQDQAVRP